MKALIFIFIFSSISSCSNFVKKMHGQISKDQRTGQGGAKNPRSRDPYRFYKNGQRKRRTSPVTYSRYGNKKPNVKRNYKKRYNAEDLEDSHNTASLWSGSGKNNVLFTSDDSKKVGDLLIVQVKNKLKTDISNELKRAFPVYKPRKKKKDEKKTPDTGQTFKNPNVSKDEEGGASAEDEKTYDILSSKIVDIVNQQYLLIKARKEIIFRKRKHYLEIQGLVSRKDVYDFDKVNSTELLDAQIFILR